jgi:hypothetical protein
MTHTDTNRHWLLAQIVLLADAVNHLPTHRPLALSDEDRAKVDAGLRAATMGLLAAGVVLQVAIDRDQPVVCEPPLDGSRREAPKE